MKRIFLATIVSVAMMSCAGESTSEVSSENTESLMNHQQRVSKEEFKAFLESNKGEVQLVDVRTPEEYAGGTIEGAINYDFYGDAFATQLASLNKEKPVMIFCKSGGRSGQTLEMMKGMGFTTVLELDGGYSGW